MRLIGMLDSPYVRRVAIAAQVLQIPFEHDPLSVFSTYERFRAINPLVKAPTFIADDGTVLVDSALIIDYLETVAGRRLMPADLASRTRALRVTGVAMAACDKIVQIVYEHGVRPPEKVHAPWLERVHQQAQAGLAALDAEIAVQAPEIESLAGLSAAITWRFMQIKLAQPVADATCPALAAFAERAEQLPAFANTPPLEMANVSTPGYRAPR